MTSLKSTTSGIIMADDALPLCTLRQMTFEFEKRCQLLIGTHNKAISVAAMRISNKDRSPAKING
jgi:hypothetical protein